MIGGDISTSPSIATGERGVILRDEIGGLRIGVSENVILLFRKPDLTKVAAINLHVAKDDAFREWFEGFRDLDAEETRADAQEILADPQLGSTEEARLVSAVAEYRWVDRLN